MVGLGTPTFTIILAVKNNVNSISATLNSIRVQINDYELIVVDAKSSDGTSSVIKKNQDIVSAHILELDNGIYDAWNKGVTISSGQWICFIGSDDIFAPDALRDYKLAISQLPLGTEYISSKATFIPNKGLPRIIGSKWSWPEFQRRMTVAHVGSMHNRALFLKYGMFDDSYAICGDYEFLLRPNAKLIAEFIDVVTVFMGAGGVSNVRLLRAYYETYRAKISSGKRSMALSMIEGTLGFIKTKLKIILPF